MSPELLVALAHHLGSPVTASAPLAGGDINTVTRVTLADGRRLVVKTNPHAPRSMFSCEARGLHFLAEARAVRIPEVYAFAPSSGHEKGDQGPAFLALEYLDRGPVRRDFDETLGRGLAELHRTGAPAFGLDHDNFIGSLAQPNEPRDTWADFYGEKRLGPQIRHASRLLSRDALHDFDRLLARIDAVTGPKEPPSRLHGDLWAGNLHRDETGAPCLIDPAVYGGHREVDLAMMRLFGGFGPRVFRAYDEVWPLAPGHEARVPLYQLYPLLVHVNLFGESYVPGVLSALRAALAIQRG